MFFRSPGPWTEMREEKIIEKDRVKVDAVLREFDMIVKRRER